MTVRTDVTALIDRPGATRSLARSIDRAEIDAPSGAWGPADEVLVGPIDVRLQLEMLLDGLLARGTVAFPTATPCARCLVDVRRAHEVEVSELFQAPHHLGEEDEIEAGYELLVSERAVDLEALLRDAVLSKVPLRVLCRRECAGLCPVCGADLNLEDCGHHQEAAPDPRWAPLAQLDLPPG